MSGLLQSRWAPSPDEIKRRQSPLPSPSPSTSTKSPSRELSRFTKIVARLKWKLPFLAEGYRLATLPVAVDRTSNSSTTATDDAAHAEIMFKIDFYEYYALLERAIVHLLGVFGITVSAALAQSCLTLYPNRSSRSSRSSPMHSHRYHANVLEALEEETCPLHSVLGNGVVYEQLKKAKDLRNRWKTADMSKEEDEGDFIRSTRDAATMPLKSYDFDGILMGIFCGLENGYGIATDHVAREEEGNNGVNGVNGKADTDEDWGFIVDAMDWEAV